MDLLEYTTEKEEKEEEEEKSDKKTSKNLDYQTLKYFFPENIFFLLKSFADERVLKEELHSFFESDILFRDKFQNETRLLKGELYNISNFKLFFPHFSLINADSSFFNIVRI